MRNSNPRKFRRAVTASCKIEKIQLYLLNQQAEAVGLTRSEYLRELLYFTVQFMLSPEEHEEFVKQSKKLDLSEYEFTRRIIGAYLKK